jgi:iron complex transport system permease protein
MPINSSANRRNAIRMVLAGLAVLGIFCLSMFIGRYHIEAGRLVQLLTTAPDAWLDHPDTSVFYYIRLPRIKMAGIVGAGLSAAGALFQGMFRNPLVSPDILGVSSGCCLGAALGIIISGQVGMAYLVPLLAFIVGIIAMFLAYGIAKISPGDQVVMLILAGIVVGGFFEAALSFIKYTADPYEDLPAIVFWIMGGFFRANWSVVLNLLIGVLPCLLLLHLLAWKINILSLGDEEAGSLGINVKVFRFLLLCLATFMVAGCVSVSGTIGWVGLVVPHIARLLSGADHRYVMPMSMLVGAGFVMLMDNLARGLTSAEIPISILTAAVGTPFFAYLLIKGRGQAWK